MALTAGTTGGFEGCQFYGNNASNGGALHLTSEYTGESVKTHFVRDSIFRHNLACEIKAEGSDLLKSSSPQLGQFLLKVL